MYVWSGRSEGGTGSASCSMSSIARYSEIPRESSSHCQLSKSLRKMSCFDTRDTTDRPRFKHTFSTNSLPRPGRVSSTLVDVIRIPPDDVASQFTLIDFDLFKKIDLEELTECGWIKKNKNQISPNVVAYTRRFNHVSYWVIEEILSQEACKVRAEIISYFTRVCKRLHELNNLHSLFAVVSALRSASIYRLKVTWSLVPKKDRQSIDRYADLFSDKDNFAKYREHLDSLKLPCIPYIGVYLTDLVYLSMANPSCSLKENLAANNVFRIVTTYQTASSYAHLPKDYPLQCQLRSIRYIDELLKFVEDDHYKKSLTLEPPNGEQSPQKFIAGHKKQSSWGSKPKFIAQAAAESASADSFRNLIDDSIVEKCEASPGGIDLSTLSESETKHCQGTDVILEGCLRRKTLLKNGKKPPMAAWQRFWVQLWGSVLLYYSAKSLTGSDRSDFKLEPVKMKSVLGWLIQLADDPLHPDSFNLADPATGTMYKFRAGSTPRALVWCRSLQECQKKRSKATNLIKFD